MEQKQMNTLKLINMDNHCIGYVKEEMKTIKNKLIQQQYYEHIKHLEDFEIAMENKSSRIGQTLSLS